MTKLTLDTSNPDAADLLRRAGIDTSAGGSFEVTYGAALTRNADETTPERLNPALVVSAVPVSTLPPPPVVPPSAPAPQAEKRKERKTSEGDS